MVELMVMFAVLAVVIVPVSSLFSSSVKTSRVSDSIYTSIGIASSIVESLRTIDRSRLRAMTATDFSAAPEPFGPSDLGVSYDAAKFRPVISAEEVTATAFPDGFTAPPSAYRSTAPGEVSASSTGAPAGGGTATGSGRGRAFLVSVEVERVKEPGSRPHRIVALLLAPPAAE